MQGEIPHCALGGISVGKAGAQTTAVSMVEGMQSPKGDRSLMKTEVEGGPGCRKLGWRGH